MTREQAAALFMRTRRLHLGCVQISYDSLNFDFDVIQKYINAAMVRTEAKSRRWAIANEFGSAPHA